MGGHRVLDGKVVIGLSENIVVKDAKAKKVLAKIDTGATKSSIDTQLAKRLGLGPIIRSKMVKSAHGTTIRPIVKATITIAGKTMAEEFTLADRNHLKFAVLIGQNILRHGFLIDPSS